MNPTLSAHTEIVDGTPWIRVAKERFGLPERLFAPYRFVRTSKQYVLLVARDHAPPEAPAPHALGLPFMRTEMAYPKLSTSAAMLFGHEATKNVIEADETQTEAFLRREPFTAPAEQTARCTGKGYVLVRHQGAPLGLGFYRPQDDGGTVRSMYPKKWMLRG